jgi:predicted RNA-binding Zn ribbon-like protein
MSNEAPGELELVRAFVNTYDAEDGSEDLPTAQALRAWLAERGLLDADAADAPVDDADAERARELREALRAMLRANHGEPLDPAATQTVDASARRAQLSVRFGPDGTARVEPLATGVDGALGRLLARVAAAMEDGTWPRLKVCPASDCQVAFYDASRNRSAVWCDMAVCGNREKVRKFRAKQRKTGAAPAS